MATVTQPLMSESLDADASGADVGPTLPGLSSTEAERRLTDFGPNAIFHVQRELEIVGDSHNPAIVLCDRGTVDGVAYWPGPEDLWSSVGTTLELEFARYHSIIHLRTPPAEHGYNHQNPLRTENAAAAADIDARILRAREQHPRRFVVESSAEFLDKAAKALDVLRGEMPDCCKRHVVPSVRSRDAIPSTVQTTAPTTT